MRIFLAINLPETIKKELAELQNEIKNSFPMEASDSVAKWVAPENLHLTLLFLGELGDKDLPFLIKAVEVAVKDTSPLDLRLTKISYGPAKKIPPQFIWLTIEKNKILEKLVVSLREKISQAKIRYDNRGASDDFLGHVTLARVKEWVWRRIDPDEQPAVDREIDLKFTANHIEIMQSQLQRTGPEYTILQSFPLSGLIR